VWRVIDSSVAVAMRKKVTVRKLLFARVRTLVRVFPRRVENSSPSEPKKRGNSRPETENEE